MKGRGAMIFLLLMGILCLGYFVLYAIKVDLTNTFTYFWLLTGIACIFGAMLPKYLKKHDITISKPLKVTLFGIVFLGASILVAAECFVIGYGVATPDQNADYVIVLGAQVKGTSPSYNLKRRLDVAYEYLEKNPETKVILSGGQGKGEDITEAQAMSTYLEEKGISKDRMLLENQSVNTYENIKYSKQLINSKKSSVIIVTNDFHVFRSVRIAKKQGIKYVQGLGATTHWYTVPNLYLREGFAVVKYFLCGQI